MGDDAVEEGTTIVVPNCRSCALHALASQARLSDSGLEKRKIINILIFTSYFVSSLFLLFLE